MLVLVNEAHLAGDGEAVGGVELGGFGVERGGGSEVCETESLAEEVEAVAEDVEGSLGIERLGEFIEEGGGSARAVVIGDDFPLAGLGVPDEVEDEVGVEGADGVEVFGVSFLVAASGEEGCSRADSKASSRLCDGLHLFFVFAGVESTGDGGGDEGGAVFAKAVDCPLHRGRRPRRPAATEERVQGDPRRPEGLPHNYAASRSANALVTLATLTPLATPKKRRIWIWIQDMSNSYQARPWRAEVGCAW